MRGSRFPTAFCQGSNSISLTPAVHVVSGIVSVQEIPLVCEGTKLGVLILTCLRPRTFGPFPSEPFRQATQYTPHDWTETISQREAGSPFLCPITLSSESQFPHPLPQPLVQGTLTLGYVDWQCQCHRCRGGTQWGHRPQATSPVQPHWAVLGALRRC